ncbi:MAG: hypothetical protein KJO11_08990 [Gemmatimonadetes bacterium]|nr:hypothetical protein [Gemmatimonadota bacterium]
MLKALSTPTNRRRTVFLLTACALLALGAAWVGIDDNPPGISLAYLSAATFAAAFTHPWRSPRSFRRLMYAAAGGIVVFAVLHNVFHAGASIPDLPRLAQQIFSGFGIASFFIAVLLCPPVFVLGAVAALVMSRRHPGS